MQQNTERNYNNIKQYKWVKLYLTRFRIEQNRNPAVKKAISTYRAWERDPND